MEDIIEKLEENVAMLEAQIAELKESFPFIYREKLKDEECVEAQIATIEGDIEALNEEIEKYKKYIVILEEWRPA